MNKCIRCNKKLSRKDAKRCKECYIQTLKGNTHPMHGANRKGIKNGNYKDGRSLLIHYCKDCTKILKDYTAKRCSVCKNVGRNNPNYVNGKSREPYPLEFNNSLKETIRIRDKYKCQKCGKQGIHVHHIDYNKSNCSIKNLITLCHKCNLKVNANRDYWYAYFTYKMENR